MIGTSSTTVIRATIKRIPNASTSSFSTAPTLLRNRMTIGERHNRVAELAKRRANASASAKKLYDLANDPPLNIAEAARVLRAVEITRPFSSYKLIVDTQADRAKNKKKVHIAPLRGRVVLPVDFRSSADKILVFASPDSADFRLAQAAGVDYVGGVELFTQLLEGEIEPNKVLCSTAMIGAVTSSLARFLGRKGLMPTARRGLVGTGEQLVNFIRDAKGGLDWRADDSGTVDIVIGRPNQSIEVVVANVRAFLSSVREAKQSQIDLRKNTDEQSIVSAVLHGKSKTATLNIPASLQSTWGPTIRLRDRA